MSHLIPMVKPPQSKRPVMTVGGEMLGEVSTLVIVDTMPRVPERLSIFEIAGRWLNFKPRGCG